MAEQETVKLEIEIPKDQLHILTDLNQAEAAPQRADSEDMNKELRIEKFKKQLAEARKSKSPAAPESKQEESESHSSQKSSHTSPLDKLPSTTDKSPPNPNQKKLIILGLVIALAGLILWPLANFVIAIAIAIVGAAAIATGTFVKV